MTRTSIVEYFGDHTSYRCGYCKNNEGSYSHGMWAHVMTAQDYQTLIDRGWRRSGKYVYKPTNSMTCCPAYTISCHALEFQLSKSQKKVLKRFNHYLMTDPFLPEKGTNLKKSQSQSSLDEDEIHEAGGGENIAEFKPKEGAKPTESLDKPLESEMKEVEEEKVASGDKQNVSSAEGSNSMDGVAVDDKTAKTSNDESRKLPSSGKVRKAKEIRKERRMMRLRQKGLDPSAVPPKRSCTTEPKSLEEFLAPAGEVKKKFSIVTVGVNSPEFEETFELEYSLYRSYQMNIHQDSESECTRKQFKRFLCDSPIVDSDNIFGTYHQQYYIDDTLVAVGVIDILPSCVSSVYFFYSTDFLPLSPGTFGALREIAHVRKLNPQYPSIRYYYMGFYIHSCIKMRYKGNFSPSYLLCPEEYTWHLLDDSLRDRLTASKYCRLNPGEKKEGNVDVNKVGVLFKGIRMTYQVYKTVGSNGEDENEVLEYANLVGDKAGKSMLLYRADS